MTSPKLPGPVAEFFAGQNGHALEATLAPFAEDAIVKDEGQEMRGLSAIRAWIAETTRKYRARFEVIERAERDGATVVTARVSGDFPGSPAEIDFAFRLRGERIAHLEIG